MEEYLIFATIGGLLFLTLFINSVSEAYEQRQREKRIKILRIKQGLEELSDLLDSLKNCNISDNIRNMIANEIMARLQMIQMLDRHFRGIQELIEEAKTNQNNTPKPDVNAKPKNEIEFKTKLIKLGRLIRTLNTRNWFSRVKPQQLNQYIRDIKLLRCEQIFQFYSDMAGAASEKERYIVAKEHYHYIIHALKGSGINDHERVIEMKEQAEFMLNQADKMFTQHAEKILNGEQGEEPEANNSDPQANSHPDEVQNTPADKP